MTRRPPMSFLGSRKAGTLPRMTINSVGKAIEKKTLIGSRRKSLSSVSVILNMLVMASSLFIGSRIEWTSSQRHEGVVEAALLDPQVVGHDPPAGQCRDDGVDQVTGPGHDDLGPCPAHDANFGQLCQQLVFQWC